MNLEEEDSEITRDEYRRCLGLEQPYINNHKS